MKKIVMKFGGTSVATGKNIRHVANLIANHASEDCGVVVVVSALDGVTDQLIKVAEEAKKGNRKYIHDFKQKLLEKHLTVANEAIEDRQLKEETERVLRERVDELEQVLKGISYVSELTPKSRDTVLSFGEKLSAPMVSGALEDMGLKSQRLTGGEAGIVTDSNYGEAGLLMNFTRYQVKKKIEPLLKNGVVPVITGYIAATQDGETTTLGRGGSDYTATIMGAALAVDEVWI